MKGSRPSNSWTKTITKHPVLFSLLLAGITALAYLPALNGGFIWDDDDYVTHNWTLRDWHGLGRMWFEIGALPQYYPLVHTTFWVEYHLWGLNPFGFHLVNVFLHGLAAILLWRVLTRLAAPGAWLGAALFAVHPVCVESVAWITERKNVLSAVFYFGAALAYLQFKVQLASSEALRGASSPKSRIGWYSVSLVLFVCALWSKTVTCTLPAALLLVSWWTKGRGGEGGATSEGAAWWRRQIVPLIPFFGVGMGLGLLTVWLEKHHVGAQGALFALTFLQRCLIAGRALWFYAWKLVWPWPLTFIYPRWEVSTGVWWQWVFPVAALGVVGLLWIKRGQWGRGPLVAVLFFAGTLLPALGFVNVYPMRFSFVADHFQYLASAGLLALVAAGLSTRLEGSEDRSTKHQLLAEGHQGTKEIPNFKLQTSKKAKGVDGQASKALPAFEMCSGVLLVVLGLLTWHQCGQYIDHETLWRVTLERNPNSFIAHNNLGNLVLRRGLVDDAMAEFKTVIQLQPDYEVAYYNLGNALLQKRQVDEAVSNYLKAVQLAPGYVGAHNNLANVYMNQGRPGDAVVQYEIALKHDPRGPILYNNLAKLLATSSDASVRNGARAVQLALEAQRLSGGREPLFTATLAAAYAEAGRFAEARATAERALELAWQQHNEGLADTVKKQLTLYQAGMPYRQR